MENLGSMDLFAASLSRSATTERREPVASSRRSDGVREPKKGSQAYKLLVAMQAGVKLTIWNAMNEYGCGALHQRVKELRDMGWPVRRRIKPGTNVAEFFMGVE